MPLLTMAAQDGLLRMLDSVEVGNLPPGADAYLGYVGGRFPTFPALQAKFPDAHLLSMAIAADEDATGCDREPGDLDVAEIAAWTHRQLARGVHRPVTYASASNMGACAAALQAAGIARDEVRLLSAHYGAGRHICGPSTCAYPGCPSCDGTQWRDNAPGTGRSKVDESVLMGDFFDGPAAPATPVLLLEETMPFMLKPGAGTKTPIALPTGTASVRFYSNTDASLLVDRRDGKGALPVKLSYGSAHAVAIPHGVHAIVAHRVDAGTNDVSCAISGVPA